MSRVMWHGYEQHPDAHPLWPWWRAVSVPGLLVWRRVDGLEETALAASAGRSDRLAWLDRERPLPAPEARCGQVWVWTASGVQAQVVEVDPEIGRAYLGGRQMSIQREAWPPSGAVLVSGPESPWAPPNAPAPAVSPREPLASR